MTMTKIEKLNAIVTAVADTKFADGTPMADFLNHEIEMVAKKNTRKSTTPTRKSKENEVIKARILAYLVDNADGATATEIAKGLDLSSPQKASALLKQLGPNGTNEVARKKIGKSTVFTLA